MANYMSSPTLGIKMILNLIFASFVFANGSAIQYEAELTKHITDHLRSVERTRSYPRRLLEAQAMIPIVLKYCSQYNVDPLRVATIMFYENSWRQKPLGDLGEVGPMQVMPKYFKKVFGLETLDSQIHAGIFHLKTSRDKCGDGAQIFQYYGSNRCGPVKGFAKFREGKYQQAVEKYRRKREHK